MSDQKQSKSLPPEGVVKLTDLIGGSTPVVPFSRATVYRMIADGRFPNPIKLGYMSVWDVKAIRSWISGQPV